MFYFDPDVLDKQYEFMQSLMGVHVIDDEHYRNIESIIRLLEKLMEYGNE